MIGPPPKFASGPPPPPPKTRPMTLTHAVLWVSGITLLFLWLGTLAISLRESAAQDVVVQFMCQVAAYSLGLFLILRVYGPDASIRQFLALRRTHAGFYAVALLLGVARVLPANLLFELSHQLFPQLDRPTDVGMMFFEASARGRVLMGLAIVLAGPIVEEVLFRGALFGPLLRSHGRAVVVVGTAAIFALVHLDVHAMVPILAVGASLGYLRLLCGSLFPAVVMHAAFNAVPLVAMALSQEPPTPSGDFDPALGPTLLSLVACVGLLVVARHLGRYSDAARVARSRDAG